MLTKLSKRKIRIQIKSGIDHARQFVAEDYPIPVIWVTDSDTPKDIRRKTLFYIVNMFPFLREQLEQKGFEIPKLNNHFELLSHQATV